jgi:hypothetical protein
VADKTKQSQEKKRKEKKTKGRKKEGTSQLQISLHDFVRQFCAYYTYVLMHVSQYVCSGKDIRRGKR